MQGGSCIVPFAAAAKLETDRLLLVLCQAASCFVLRLVVYCHLLFLMMMKLHLVVFYLFAMLLSGVVDDDDCVRLRLGSSR